MRPPPISLNALPTPGPLLSNTYSILGSDLIVQPPPTSDWFATFLSDPQEALSSILWNDAYSLPVVIDSPVDSKKFVVLGSAPRRWGFSPTCHLRGLSFSKCGIFSFFHTPPEKFGEVRSIKQIFVHDFIARFDPTNSELKKFLTGLKESISSVHTYSTLVFQCQRGQNRSVMGLVCYLLTQIDTSDLGSRDILIGTLKKIYANKIANQLLFCQKSEPPTLEETKTANRLADVILTRENIEGFFTETTPAIRTLVDEANKAVDEYATEKLRAIVNTLLKSQEETPCSHEFLHQVVGSLPQGW